MRSDSPSDNHTARTKLFVKRAKSQVEATMQQIYTEIERFCQNNYIGQVADTKFMAATELVIRQQYAKRLDIPVSEIQLVNFRLSADGTVITWDGVKYQQT
jgi:Tfp pilus assembly protein PilE